MSRQKKERRALARAAGADGSREPGRFSARRKTETILRLLRGESLDTLARELGVTAGTLAQWREAFLAGGQRALKSRARSCWPAGWRAGRCDDEGIQAVFGRYKGGIARGLAVRHDHGSQYVSDYFQNELK